MPNERTYSFIRARAFLMRISSASGGGFKRIPKDVREEARRILRHFPHPSELGRAEQFDKAIIDEYYDKLCEEIAPTRAKETLLNLDELNNKPVNVDPPNGWRYGFPKVYNPETDGGLRDWLIKNGYPRKIIEELDEHLYCRFWLVDPEDTKIA